MNCQSLPINSFPDQFSHSSFLLFPTKALAGRSPLKVVLGHSQGLPCSCPFSGVCQPPLPKDEPPGPVQESTQQARDTVHGGRGLILGGLNHLHNSEVCAAHLLSLRGWGLGARQRVPMRPAPDKLPGCLSPRSPLLADQVHPV